LEGSKPSPEWEKQENEADKFSQKTLIPANEFQEFKNNYDFSASSIREFSRHIGVAPGIIAGRLQHEKILPYTHHTDRIRYKWK
jgi:Zn-dependent peptidase ImmA (M78 family)